MSEDSKRQAGTLARGLAILDFIRTADRPLTLADIVESCGLDVSTTHRLLQMLHTSGYILRDEKTKRYVGSPKLLFPLSIYSPLSDFRREAGLTANRIRSQTGQTAGFVLFCLDERIIVEVSAGMSSLTLAYDTWLQSPIHASVSGKILILSKGEARRRAYIEALDLQRHTEYTICDADALEAELSESYGRGFVTARDEYFVGLTAIGAPIWSQAGACLGCTFLNVRSADVDMGDIETFGAVLKNEANLFSHATPCLEPVGRILNAPIVSDFSSKLYGIGAPKVLPSRQRNK